MRASLASCAVLGALLLAAIPSAPALATAAGALYELGPTSDHEIGCFAPCECPVLILVPVTGTFRLSPLGFDGLYQHFAVNDVRWSVPRDGRPTPVVGSGHYRTGGEVAQQQQLTLDLAIGSGPVQHFDSGLVSGGGSLSKIDIAVAVHQFFCWDTTFTIHASAKTASVVGPAPAIALGAATPNPFQSKTRLELSLATAAEVTVSVHDVRGRLVATIVRGQRLEAGPNAIEWDGRDEAGAPSPPGIYFVRAVVSGDEATVVRAITRLMPR